MSHTRGPWLAASHPANGRLPIVSQANGRSVGSVSWFGTLPEGFKGHEQECHANAKLIAAAPDLLAALKTIAAVPVHSRDDDGENCQQMAAMARLAIAKAGVE